ncbi:hypothetical protein ACFQ0D_33825, partial [Micromonospora zhanjiangensis]
MADGEETPKTRKLRPAAPAMEGPLASSGAAPDRSSLSESGLPGEVIVTDPVGYGLRAGAVL